MEGERPMCVSMAPIVTVAVFGVVFVMSVFFIDRFHKGDIANNGQHARGFGVLVSMRVVLIFVVVRMFDWVIGQERLIAFKRTFAD